MVLSYRPVEVLRSVKSGGCRIYRVMELLIPFCLSFAMVTDESPIELKEGGYGRLRYFCKLICGRWDPARWLDTR